MRMHPNLFTEYDGSAFKAFAAGEAVVDPTTPDRLSRQLAALKPTDTVMLSTLTDAWSPEAQEHDLGRRCLEKLLRESKARVRILTKNAAVANELELAGRVSGPRHPGPEHHSTAFQGEGGRGVGAEGILHPGAVGRSPGRS
jgi:hypothetical protein